MAKDDDDNGARGWLDTFGSVARIVTPAGVVAIYAALSGISGDIDRNCDATANLARATGAIVAVDNELANDKRQRQFVRELLKGIPSDCNS